MAVDPARAKSLFLNASDLTDPAERAAYLARECGEDAELRRRVEALLSANDASPLPAPATVGPNETPDATGLPEPRPEGGLHTTVEHRSDAKPDVLIAGRYTLQEKIGEGGMGEVWVAKQSEPVKRRVALKLIKTGMDSRAVLQRFEQERQALAMMDHPNIARVLDAGLTPSGQPFFAMELVNGLPLNRFCDEARLPTKDRLELFVSICNAVQHAHQKGIVHRDLKPANILITIIDGKPVPKVIDFGVAKATAGKLTDDSLSTQFGAIVGTLEYMSPEQAGFSGEDIDTRADIYSLGVILYELLTGLRPIDANRLRKAALTEMIRIIREEDPSKPSTRLSTEESLPSLAAVRQIEPRRLLALLRGELDWVVMKCLEKRRDRRYETASGLARDIQRFLADEAVEARPPSAGYRLGKFLHRNRRSVLAAALVLLAALGGLSAALAVQVRSNAALTKANGETRAALEKVTKAQKATADALAQSEESREQAEAVGNLLIGTFQKPDPSIEGKDVKVADVLDQALDGLARGFAGSKATEAAFLDALGQSYSGLGLYNKAAEARGKALAIRESTLGPNHPRTLASRAKLAEAYLLVGRIEEAIAMYEATLKLCESKLGPGHPDSLASRNELANAYLVAGRIDEAIKLREAALKLCESALGPDHPVTFTCRVNLAHDLAVAYGAAGQVAKVIAMHEATLKLCESKLGFDHPNTLTNRISLAVAYGTAGRIDDAIAMNEGTLKLMESKLGPDHPHTLGCRSNLVTTYRAAGRIGDAIAMADATLKLYESKHGPDHRNTLIYRDNLAATYRAAGRADEAITIDEATIRLSESTHGPTHLDTLVRRNTLAIAYGSAGRIGESIAMHEGTLKICEATLGPTHLNTLTSRNNLAAAYQAAGRIGEAIAMHEATLKLRESAFGPDHLDTLGSRNNLADAYRAAGRFGEAITMDKVTTKLFESRLGPYNPYTLTSLGNLALDFEKLGRLAEAEPLHRDILSRLRKAEKPDSLLLAGALATFGRNLLMQSKWSEAEPFLRECLAIRLKAIPDEYRRFNVESMLGGALLGQGRFDEAEPLVVGGYEGMKSREAKIPANGRSNLSEAADRVVQLYRAWGKPEQAAAWSARLGLNELPRELFAK